MKIIKVEMPETDQEHLDYWVKQYKEARAELESQEKESGSIITSTWHKVRNAERMVGRYYLRVLLKKPTKEKR